MALVRARQETLAMSVRVALAVLMIGGTLLPSIVGAATPCAADIEKFCANVPIGGGRIQACLQEHEAELSPACAARHENLASEMGTLVATCRYDISRFCWDVSPGHGRVARCLEQHQSDLSPVCQDQMKKKMQPAGR